MRGGKREGAGRKRGGLSQKTTEIARITTETGVTPLEYLINVMRDEKNPQPVRMEAAKSAAPFIHPRLSSIDANVKVAGHEDALDELE